jgi:hypothetical protein
LLFVARVRLEKRFYGDIRFAGPDQCGAKYGGHPGLEQLDMGHRLFWFQDVFGYLGERDARLNRWEWSWGSGNVRERHRVDRRADDSLHKRHRVDVSGIVEFINGSFRQLPGIRMYP